MRSHAGQFVSLHQIGWCAQSFERSEQAESLEGRALENASRNHKPGFPWDEELFYLGTFRRTWHSL